MKLRFSISLILTALTCCLYVSCSNPDLYSDMGEKPRIVVLTDIAPGNIEPDDMESMIRLMAHADLFEIEGIILCFKTIAANKEQCQ